MFRLNNASIAYRLTFLVICFSSLVAVVATAVQLTLDYRRDLFTLHAFLNSIEATSLRPLEESVWVLDDLQINLQLEGLTKREGIVHAAVEMNGAMAWEKGAPAEDPSILRRYPLVHRNGRQLEGIGQLRVQASLRPIYERLLDRIVILLISNTLKTFLVSGLILFLFRKHLTRHLVRLADYVRLIDIRASLPAPLQLERSPSHKPDELDQVVSVLNELCQSGHQAFAQLRAHEERLRLFFNATEEAVFGVDLDGICTFANRACLECFQATGPETIVGRNLLELIADQSRPHDWPCPISAQVRATMQEVRALTADNLILYRASGPALRIALRSYPVRDQDRCVGAIVFFSDLSRLQQLEREKLLFSRVISQAPVLIFITNADGLIEYCNATFERLVGLSADQVIGRNAIDCLDPLWTGAGLNPDHLRKAIQNGQDAAGRFVLVGTDGLRISLELDLLPIRAPGGCLEHLIGVGRNVTREQELLEQLQHVQKMRAIGQLAASLAHEFGNPLLGIRFALKDIKQRPSLDAEAREVLRLAEEECDRMRNLLRELQHLNRPSTGRMTLCDLDEMIDSLLSLNRTYLEKRKISVSKDFHAGQARVLAVEDQIRQVFVNLILNAADAMAGQGGMLAIRTGREGEMMLISFEDTGPGIAPEHFERLFEPFFTTKAVSGGSGLGLAVSYGIVRSHGGSIRVQSEPGKTVFTVTLPQRLE